MKKKIILLGFVLCLGLVGCTSEKTTEIENVEVSTPVVESEVVEEYIPIPEEYEVSEQILEADMGSGLIQIGNDIFQLPMTVKEFTTVTNAIYYNGDYVTSNEHVLSDNDTLFLGKLNFEDVAGASVEYAAWVVNKDFSTAGEGYLVELRDVSSESIIFPKGIKAGMSLTNILEVLGDDLEESFLSDDDYLILESDFLVTDEKCVEKCNDVWKNTRDIIPENYKSNLTLTINRKTGLVECIDMHYGYSVE